MVPADAVLLGNEGLDGCAREAVVGERSVVNPAVDAGEKEIEENLASSEGCTSGT